MNLDEMKFDEKGLIPAIVQDATTKEVLTLAYMNRESAEEIHGKRGKHGFTVVPVRSCGIKGKQAVIPRKLWP